MSPEVVTRKLARMAEYLEELRPYGESPFETFWVDHHKIERLIELLGHGGIGHRDPPAGLPGRSAAGLVSFGLLAGRRVGIAEP
jgi:hypothetical protein